MNETDKYKLKLLTAMSDALGVPLNTSAKEYGDKIKMEYSNTAVEYSAGALSYCGFIEGALWMQKMIKNGTTEE